MNLFEKMVEELKISNLPTILYGSGVLSVMVDAYLEENGIVVAGFVVDQEYYKESAHNGKPVYILSDYVTKNSCNIVLAFSYLSIEWENKLRSLVASKPDTKIYLLDFQAYLALPGNHRSYESFYRENRQILEELRNQLCDGNSKKALDDFIEQKLTGIYRKPCSDGAAFFDSDVIKFSENEVYVDCGAYNGDTVIGFAENLKRNGIDSYGKIYAFEADIQNVHDMGENLKGYDNVEVIAKGVYDRARIMRFIAQGTAGSHISDEGVEIEVTSIDEAIKGGVTFIKMDIEGSELMALKGAEQTIRRFKPKLAICVYHRVEDLITIPQYIKSLNPDYNLYFRKYWPNAVDAVLYAI